MSEVAIRIENIGKLYRLGEFNTGTLSHDLNRWWARVRGKEDPYAKLGEANDRTSKGHNDYVWALKNVSFDVKQGEVVGIIGSNGAGKSTLLKILSEITTPTTGEIKIKGRIASLLEVGTGFHPDLTGKENIFLNGAILGMTKTEIRSKLDEIVAFAGIERYLETPVKRYSSGMYVRLAFAVAAHLEPDILIIDEVLAVGDAEFQKKCLTKMKDVSVQENRTILFVSHNLQAINTLCSKAIWMDKGQVKMIGDAPSVVNAYSSRAQQHILKQSWPSLKEAPGNEFITMLSVELIPHLEDPNMPLDIRTPLTLKYRFINKVEGIHMISCIYLYTVTYDCIFNVCCTPDTYNKGEMEAEWLIPGNLLNDGSYIFTIQFIKDTTQEIFTLHECLHFQLEDYRENTYNYEKWAGYIRPQLPVRLKKIEHV